MKLYHGTSYENALNICTTDNFIGGTLNACTYENRSSRDGDYACQLEPSERVVYFTPNLDYAQMYTQNDNDCMVVIEIDESLMKSMLEIDKNYFYADEEFYIYENILNENMKIIGIYDENGDYQEEWKEWCF